MTQNGPKSETRDAEKTEKAWKTVETMENTVFCREASFSGSEASFYLRYASFRSREASFYLREAA